VAGWFSRWWKSDGDKSRPDAKRRRQPTAKNGRGKKKNDHRHQPAPLTWNNPEQDFITRYGDPFDG